MVGQFRFAPPSPSVGLIPRPRLQERLAMRWSRRVATVVAGPGFGKTVLLTTMLRDGTADHRSGRDVWLCCEPADAAADHLAGGLAEALGITAGGFDAVVEAVWARAPAPTCLVLDDLHEVPAGSPGADLLARLATELPRNGHLVLGSRGAVPIPLARLAANGEVERLKEDELLLDDEELATFAAARGIDVTLLAHTGGWPALAELTATAGTDLVLDYLWEEVLEQVGPKRRHVLAGLAAVGGGDDEVASAIAGEPVRVGEVVAGIPLIETSPEGWTALHALWGPPLRRTLSDHEAREARRQVAAVHGQRGRARQAVALLAEADAWDDVLDVMRHSVLTFPPPASPRELGRWHRLLPPARHGDPRAQLTAALELHARDPRQAVPGLRAAAEGFHAEGDDEGELAALAAEGLAHWWVGDVDSLRGVLERVIELAGAGSVQAERLVAIGVAAQAHVLGDSAGVLAALAKVGDDLPAGWSSGARWLRSVAHRRDGDLVRARHELDAAAALGPSTYDPQLQVADLRTAWLEGAVDRVVAEMEPLPERFRAGGSMFLSREIALEVALRAAWIGRLDRARELLDRARSITTDVASPLQQILEVMTAATIAVGDGDEDRAAELLADDAATGAARADRWYWRDRAALALLHVLVPRLRSPLDADATSPTHRPGVQLAGVLSDIRDGSLDSVKDLGWPPTGTVRANLPLAWQVELAMAGTAAGNPPPEDLLEELGAGVRPAVRAVVARHSTTPVGAAGRRWLNEQPAVPGYRTRIDVLGPLQVHRDGVRVAHPHLRRERVRELLCFLVEHQRCHRERIAETLWPGLDDGGRNNLRVTLNYLQQVLQPDRADGDPPYLVRLDGAWMHLTGGDQLEVDAWELAAHLDAAEQADGDGSPSRALAAYRAALPLYRGDYLADTPYADWAEVARTGLRARFVAGAVRAGELLLAVARTGEAQDAAERALAAEPSSEPAYRLLARVHIANGDRAAARRTVDTCRAALADLGLQPGAETLALAETTVPPARR